MTKIEPAYTGQGIAHLTYKETRGDFIIRYVETHDWLHPQAIPRRQVYHAKAAVIHFPTGTMFACVTEHIIDPPMPQVRSQNIDACIREAEKYIAGIPRPEMGPATFDTQAVKHWSNFQQQRSQHAKL